MCGIAGVVWRDPLRSVRREDIVPMLDAIAHRGPDDEGVVCDRNVGLGHRRLSILDLSEAGHQPMLGDDGRFAIVLNGEIYNYIELREELRQYGIEFRSETDTEVLLAAFRVWGRDCVLRLSGMWAFAIHDRRENRVFLSRDRMGIKPLYYLRRPDVLAFGSEIKAILAVFPEERRVHLPYLHYFMPSGALDDGPETCFANVVALLPAHSAELDVTTGAWRTWEYWSPQSDVCRAHWIGDRDPLDVLSELLDSSVDLHLRSDVPVGTCLSGGLDSSALVGLASSKLAAPIHTFSGLYPDRDCDESEFVQAVNAHTRTRPVAVEPKPSGDLLDDLARITWHQDEPTAGPGLYTQFHVMRHAHEHVKVLLDGQGGDELFAGYLPYFVPFLEDSLDCGGVLRWLKGFATSLGMYRHWGRSVGSQGMRAVLARLSLRLPSRSLSVSSRDSEPPFFHPDLAARVHGAEISRERPQVVSDRLGNMLYWHLRQQSIPALLHYEDRNSMAYSIEARVPYLDHRIVEFALGLDSDYKIRGTWTKWILRKVAEPYLPKKVTWRRSKMGYPTPFARWLRQSEDRDPIRDLLFSRSFLERGLVTRDSLEFYWNQHQQGVDRSWLLYRYVTLELWHRHFIDRWDPCPARRPRPLPLGGAR